MIKYCVNYKGTKKFVSRDKLLKLMKKDKNIKVLFWVPKGTLSK